MGATPQIHLVITPTMMPLKPQTEGDDNNWFSFGFKRLSKTVIKIIIQALVNDKKSEFSVHLPQGLPQQAPLPPMPTGYPPMMQLQYTRGFSSTPVPRWSRYPYGITRGPAYSYCDPTNARCSTQTLVSK